MRTHDRAPPHDARGAGARRGRAGGAQAALEYSSAEHIVLSGTCCCSSPVSELHADLAQWRGRTRMQMIPVPSTGGQSAQSGPAACGASRRRFITIRDQTIFVGRVPLRTYKRPIPGRRCLIASPSSGRSVPGRTRRWRSVLDRPDLVPVLAHDVRSRGVRARVDSRESGAGRRRERGRARRSALVGRLVDRDRAPALARRRRFPGARGGTVRDARVRTRLPDRNGCPVSPQPLQRAS